MTDLEQSAAQEAGAKRNLSTPLFVAVGLVLLALMAYGFLSSGEGGRLQPGEPVPEFDLELLDGSSLRWSDLQGQVVVLNFWASWCAPCRREASDLQAVWEAYRDQGVLLVGITYRDAQDASRTFVDEHGITYPNGVDEMGRISDAYGVTAVPETYVIDRQGQLAWSQIGELRAEVLTRQLEQLLD
jgi:DsbE subfamily thiol:disulfide oxidoreductase